MARGRTLALCGMDRAEETALRSLIEAAMRLGAGQWRVVGEAEAEILLIDVDSMYGQMAWLKAQSSGKPIVALTSAQRADADFRLGRPASAESVAAVLAEVNGGTSAAPAAPEAVTANAVTEPAATPLPTEQPKAENVAGPSATPLVSTTSIAPLSPQPRRLLDFLRDGSLPGPVRLHGSEPVLAVDPIAKTYLGGAALKPLLPLASREIRDEHWDAITPAEFTRLKSELGEPQPLARLLWLAGLGAGDGELLPELAAATRFKLNKYPQAEREFPRHVRIALGMLKGASTLDELAAASGASRAEVADYVNACHVLGLVEAEGLAAAEPVAAEPTRPGGLLGRLRGKR